MSEAASSEAPPPSVKVAAGITVAVMVLIAIFLGITYALSLPAWGGFLFIAYWAGIRHLAKSEFWPSLIGGLGGLTAAFLCHWLPTLGGLGGLGVLVMVVAAVYLVVRQQLSLLVNQGFMLLLTVGNIPELIKSDYTAIGASFALGAAYAGGLFWLVLTIAARRAGGAVAAAPAE